MAHLLFELVGEVTVLSAAVWLLRLAWLKLVAEPGVIWLGGKGFRWLAQGYRKLDDHLDDASPDLPGGDTVTQNASCCKQSDRLAKHSASQCSPPSLLEPPPAPPPPPWD